MNDTGASEEEAREHIRKLIDGLWKKVNEDRMVKSPFSQKFIEICMNIVRTSQCMYQKGDGHAVEDEVTEDRVSQLIVQPISAPK